LCLCGMDVGVTVLLYSLLAASVLLISMGLRRRCIIRYVCPSLPPRAETSPAAPTLAQTVDARLGDVSTLEILDVSYNAPLKHVPEELGRLVRLEKCATLSVLYP
jgi:hypothetical protein